MTPLETRYAKSGDIHIAYQVAGSEPAMNRTASSRSQSRGGWRRASGSGHGLHWLDPQERPCPMMRNEGAEIAASPARLLEDSPAAIRSARPRAWQAVYSAMR